MRTWIIGSDPECDLVVPQPTVSRRHCRLTRQDDGDVVEDLGSSNGTFVNGVLIKSPTRLIRGDTVTLGSSVPMPWPDDDVSKVPTLNLDTISMLIGRDAECDRMIDLPMVSGRHARLSVRADGIVIEDLRSTNGTFVNGRRIDGEATVVHGDSIGLGSLLMTLNVTPVETKETSRVTSNHADATFPIRAQPVAVPAALAVDTPLKRWAISSKSRWLFALVVQAPLLAGALVLVLRQNPGALLFWISLAAVWIGISTTVMANPIGIASLGNSGITSRRSPVITRLSLLLLSWILQCLLLWAVIAPGAALRAPAATTLGIIILAASVGLSAGLVISSLGLGSRANWVVATAVVALLWVLGSGAQSGWLPSWAATISNTLPTRWAYEGLLLLEADSAPAADNARAMGEQEMRQLAEKLFPAATDRMGPMADAMALGLMMIGLLAVAVFISTASKVGRETP